MSIELLGCRVVADYHGHLVKGYVSESAEYTPGSKLYVKLDWPVWVFGNSYHNVILDQTDVIELHGLDADSID